MVDMKLISDNLEFGCKLITETFNIPIIVINDSGEIFTAYNSMESHNPFYLSIEDFLQNLTIPISNSFIPAIHTSKHLEKLISIPYRTEESSGRIYLGPTVFPKPSSTVISELTKNSLSTEKERLFNDYYFSLPVINSWKLIQASIMLVYILYHVKLDVREVILENKKIEDTTFKQLDPARLLIESRQNSYFHHDPSIEKRLYQYITEGRREELLLYWKSFRESPDFNQAVLSRKSEIRNQKNLTIATITLATRAAIEGGLHYEVAYTMGDMQIQELEEINNIPDIISFKENCLCEFVERVSSSNSAKYSKVINECHQYIYQHIYENISLATVAEHVSLKPKYLSNLFKKEAGISMTEYIQRTKIDEAIKLMEFSDYSLAEINSLLNFTDQSYFTKIFKKYTGITPKQYQCQSHQSELVKT